MTRLKEIGILATIFLIINVVYYAFSIDVGVGINKSEKEQIMDEWKKMEVDYDELSPTDNNLGFSDSLIV